MDCLFGMNAVEDVFDRKQRRNATMNGNGDAQ
jgi:hypothetical protein